MKNKTRKEMLDFLKKEAQKAIGLSKKKNICSNCGKKYVK
jgi:hypothetical protein